MELIDKKYMRYRCKRCGRITQRALSDIARIIMQRPGVPQQTGFIKEEGSSILTPKVIGDRSKPELDVGHKKTPGKPKPTGGRQAPSPTQ